MVRKKGEKVFLLLAKANLPIVKFITIIVGGHNIQQQNIFGFGVKTGHTEFHLRKHLSVNERKKRGKKMFRLEKCNSNIFFFVSVKMCF